ncbi:MAG TPA: hypothetical protein VK962_01945 [Actinomycetota bacterium]|nr:hypothetical protein [Actinomycetota bacterium]
MEADHPFGVDLRGTTQEEALAGQTLDAALARERPERWTTEEALAVADDGVPDLEGELVAEGFLLMDVFASPEESALSVRAEAPGATDHDDPYPRTRIDRASSVLEEIVICASSQQEKGPSHAITRSA